MSKELRVVLIVFGSLFGLFVLAVVAAALLLPQIAKTVVRGASDPAALAQTARKIATFTVPAGYRIASATDLGLSQTVTLVRAEGRRGFSMQLQGSSLPQDPDTSFKSMKFALGLGAKLANCTLRDAGVDDVVVRGTTAHLRALACDGEHSMRVEVGSVPGNAVSVTLIATAIGTDFDTAALHELLQSIK